MKWYTYRQSNSGGYFTGPRYVIVQAESSAVADVRAEESGHVYFDGCSKGMDCSCCGDRWDRTWDDGDDVPSIYGEPVDMESLEYNDCFDAPAGILLVPCPS